MLLVWRIVLIAAYAILGLAATGRAIFQISTKFSQAPLPYALSAVSAVIYVVIAIALWRRWDRFALYASAGELIGVILVGGLGVVRPDIWPAATVWTGFGSGYGWVPLALPLLALGALVRARRRT